MALTTSHEYRFLLKPARNINFILTLTLGSLFSVIADRDVKDIVKERTYITFNERCRLFGKTQIFL